MAKLPEPPETFKAFIQRFPELAEAWRMTQDAGTTGPLDERTARLIKLAIAIGTRQEGSVHSAVRKALAAGVGDKEIDQVISLAAGTIGFPATVAVFSWIQTEIEKHRSASSESV